MSKMLVLLNRLEIEDFLSELKEIAKTHGIAKVYLARVLPDFGSRVRSIVAPHKLDMVKRMSDAAAHRYLSQIASALSEGGIDYEPVKTSIRPDKIDDYIKANDIDLIVNAGGKSGLYRWPSVSLTGKPVRFIRENMPMKHGEDRSRPG